MEKAAFWGEGAGESYLAQQFIFESWDEYFMPRSAKAVSWIYHLLGAWITELPYSDRAINIMKGEQDGAGRGSDTIYEPLVTEEKTLGRCYWIVSIRLRYLWHTQELTRAQPTLTQWKPS